MSGQSKRVKEITIDTDGKIRAGNQPIGSEYLKDSEWRGTNSVAVGIEQIKLWYSTSVLDKY